MIQTTPVDLENIEYFSEPFPHCHTIHALEPDIALDILRWMETDAPWELVETDFYEQFEFNLRKIELPEHLCFLVDDPFSSAILEHMTRIFNIPLLEKVEIVAHKLVPGQSIRIHNDYLKDAETHRLIIHLNSGWSDSHGGLFVIFASEDAENIHRVISPLHNSAIGFAISDNSHHAVSTIYNDARYSLICSFRPAQ